LHQHVCLRVLLLLARRVVLLLLLLLLLLQCYTPPSKLKPKRHSSTPDLLQVLQVAPAAAGLRG
jgi:hypothetical protein